MHIGIFEPAIGRIGRPHHDEVIQIAAALRRQGARVTVHTHSSVKPHMTTAFDAHAVDVVPTFALNDFSPGVELLNSIATWTQIIERTTEDLQRVPEYDIAFWPAIMACQLQAIASAPRGRVIIAGNDGQLHVRGPLASDIYANALRRADALGPRLHHCYYDRRLAEADRALLDGRPFALVPNPFGGTARRDRAPGEPLQVGILGAMRPERGLEMIVEIVTGLLERGLQVTIQSSLRTIEGLPASERLRVLDYVEDFAALVAECDLVIWPSHPAPYQRRPSGVGWVAIACGVPVVMPALCLPAQILSEFGAGSFFTVMNAGFVLDAVDRAIRDYPRLDRVARERAVVWNRSEGPDHLARAILARA